MRCSANLPSIVRLPIRRTLTSPIRRTSLRLPIRRPSSTGVQNCGNRAPLHRRNSTYPRSGNPRGFTIIKHLADFPSIHAFLRARRHLLRDTLALQPTAVTWSPAQRTQSLEAILIWLSPQPPNHPHTLYPLPLVHLTTPHEYLTTLLSLCYIIHIPRFVHAHYRCACSSFLKSRMLIILESPFFSACCIHLLVHMHDVCLLIDTYLLCFIARPHTHLLSHRLALLSCTYKYMDTYPLWNIVCLVYLSSSFLAYPSSSSSLLCCFLPSLLF